MERFQWVFALGLGLAIAAGLFYLLSREDEPLAIAVNPPLPTATHTVTPTVTPTLTPKPVEIYVTGAVAQPQSRLNLPYGSRVEDAIASAGGALETADLNRVNLAAILQDGDQIHVPFQPTLENIESTPVPTDIATATPNTPRLINLNLASAEELETLPRIGPALAQAIIEYRDTQGGFTSIEDIMKVSGIGEATFEGLRELISVE